MGKILGCRQEIWYLLMKLQSDGLNPDLLFVGSMVLARISKMPVQNSNFKISARPHLAIDLLQILIQATFNSLVCHKGQFTLQLCPRRWFVRKIFVYYPQKSKLKNLHRNFCLSKQEVFRKLPVRKTGRTSPG